MNNKSMRHLPILLILILILATALSNPASAAILASGRELVYQISTYDSLNNGGYGGIVPLKDLTRHGDFGIGTFEGINGEMVVIDHIIYQVTVDGKVHAKRGKALEEELTPYAVVTYFDTDIHADLANLETYNTLQARVSKLFPNPNHFYAIRIDGTFDYIKARSVPAQSKPYPPLTEVIKQQAVFEYGNIQGSLVGFWCPSYVGGVNVPGFHLHFISNDRVKGGHLLELKLKSGTIRIDETAEFYVKLGR